MVERSHICHRAFCARIQKKPWKVENALSGRSSYMKLTSSRLGRLSEHGSGNQSRLEVKIPPPPQTGLNRAKGTNNNQHLTADSNIYTVVGRVIPKCISQKNAGSHQCVLVGGVFADERRAWQDGNAWHGQTSAHVPPPPLFFLGKHIPVVAFLSFSGWLLFLFLPFWICASHASHLTYSTPERGGRGGCQHGTARSK